MISVNSSWNQPFLAIENSIRRPRQTQSASNHSGCECAIQTPLLRRSPPSGDLQPSKSYLPHATSTRRVSCHSSGSKAAEILQLDIVDRKKRQPIIWVQAWSSTARLIDLQDLAASPTNTTPNRVCPNSLGILHGRFPTEQTLPKMRCFGSCLAAGSSVGCVWLQNNLRSHPREVEMPMLTGLFLARAVGT